MKRRSWAALLVVATSLFASPAAAVQAFGPMVVVPDLGRGCVLGPAVASADAVEALASCTPASDGRVPMAYAALRRGAWTMQSLGRYGQPVAVAKDTTGLYVLYRAETADGAAAILHRDTRGSVTSRPLGRAGAVGAGAVVARNGKWWAVWAGASGSGRNFALVEAGTMFGQAAPRPITDGTQTTDSWPSLALRDDGRLVMLWQRTADPTTPGADVRVATRGSSRWVSRALSTADAAASNIATDGRHVFAFWISLSKPVVASDESGTLTPRRFPTRACVTSGSVAAASGQVIAAFNQCAPTASGGESGFAVTALERRAGTWTSAALYRSDSTVRPATTVVTANGRATVVFSDGRATRSYSRAQ